jgi:putative phage-type endonuclease
MSLSPERDGRLTASDFAAAMGLNPSKPRPRLYREKIGTEPPFNGNHMTQYGNDNEMNAIEAYELDQRVFVDNCGDNQIFLKHPKHDWLGCTPDGRVMTENRLVEVKCPWGKMHTEAKPQYVAQTMGQMAITGATECDLTVWSPEELRIWRIQFSQEYWDMQLPLLEYFWQCVLDKTIPKPFHKTRNPKPVMPPVDIELLF